MSIDRLANDVRRILRRGVSVQVRPSATALPSPVAITSITDDGAGTATVVTTAAHGFSTSDDVVIFGAYQPRFNKTATITVTNSTTFTYSVSGSVAGTATGYPSCAESVAIDSADRFYSLGEIADASLVDEPILARKDTAGKQHQRGSTFTLEFTMLQVSDIEMAALEDLCSQYLDIAVFPKGCHEQHDDSGVMLSLLNNGFLIYGEKFTSSGTLDLSGGDRSGIVLKSTFEVDVSPSNIIVGQ